MSTPSEAFARDRTSSEQAPPDAPNSSTSSTSSAATVAAVEVPRAPPASAPRSSTYDAVPYTAYAFPQCDPRRLYCAATLFGISAHDPATARVLEIGCASGGNIIPLAARMPGAQFLGIDLSQRQIAEGQARIAAMGLTNITLRCQDIRDFEADETGYGYILCHGVYSWVPSDTQTAVLRACRANLARHGVAFVSYNTYPGWKTREILRDAMLFHTDAIAEPREKLAHGRGMIDYMRSLSGETSMFAHILREEATLVRDGADDYVVHEHLETDNHPCYFHRFASKAASQGLAYLADTTLSSMFAENLGPEMHGRLMAACGGEQIVLEQYLDFASNRAFRQSLLVRDEDSLAIDRRLDHGKLRQFAYRGAFAAGEAAGENGMVFRGRGGAFVNSNEPREIAVLNRLAGGDAGAIAWSDLHQAMLLSSPATQTAVAGGQVAVDQVGGNQVSGDAELDAAGLDALLAKLIVSGLVEMFNMALATPCPAFERPVIDPVARQLAGSNTAIVCNALHEPFVLTPAQRVLVPLLDGTTDRMAMRQSLAAAVAAQQLFFWKGQEAIVDTNDVWQMTQFILDDALQGLARGHLLQSSPEALAA